MQLLSVIVPVYNVEKFINDCIDSILGQSYKNIELILVDDGSTDSSGEICDKYCSVDKRVKVIHQNNKGCSAARNAGIANSLVSMNMWGLTPDFLDVLEEGFKEFFEKEVLCNPLKAEYLIPIFIGELLEQGKMSVKVLKTNDTWYGMTYHEDVAAVKGSFKKMLENGVYRADLFSDL